MTDESVEPDPAPHVNRMVLEIVAEIEVTKAAEIAAAEQDAAATE